MKNQSVSDFVAATMDAVLNSAEHKALFGTQYKFAQDMNDAKKHDSMCAKHNKMDSCAADDNDAKKKKFPFQKEDSSDADDQYAKKKKDDEDDADDQYAKKKKDEDSSDQTMMKMMPVMVALI